MPRLTDIRAELTAPHSEEDEPIAFETDAFLEQERGDDSEDRPSGYTGSDSSSDDDAEDDDADEEVVQTRVNDTVVKRAKRKKKRKNVATKKQRSPRKTLDEIPRDEVLDLQRKGHTTVKLEIKRQNPGGTWSQIRTVSGVPPYALFELSGPVRAFAGGGKFVYTILSEQTREQLVDRWSETYDGQPKETPEHMDLAYDEHLGNLKIIPKEAQYGVVTPPVAPSPGGAPGRPMQPMQTGYGMAQQLAPQPPAPHQGPIYTHPLYQQALQSGPAPQVDPRTGKPINAPPSSLLPSWMASYSPEVQWNHVLQKRIEDLEKQQGGQMNGMAGQWVHHEIRRAGDTQAELASVRAQFQSLQAQLHEKVETIRREAEQAVEREKEARVNAEKALERERSEAKYEALLARIESKETRSTIDWPSLITAVAPLGTAALSVMGESRKLEKSSSTEMMKTMLETSKKKDPGLFSNPEGLAALIGAVAPLVTAMFDRTGPQAQAEVMNLQHEQQMMHLKMLADMVGQSVPEENPMRDVINAAIGMVGAYMQQRQQHQLPGQPQGLPPGQQTSAQTQAPQPGQPQSVPALGQLVQQMKQSDAQAGSDVELILKRLPSGLGFHTPEWSQILFNIHTKLAADEMAPILLDRLIECARYQMMPAPLQDVFTNPREALQRVLQPLPITERDPEYVTELIEAVLDEMEARERANADDDADDDAGGVDAKDGVVGYGDARRHPDYSNDSPAPPTQWIPGEGEDVIDA